MSNNDKPITDPILDKLGQPITPGCIIAYGHALGRCAALRLGKVIKVSGTLTPGFTYTGGSYPEKREYRITVFGANDDNVDHNEPDKKNEAPALLSKKSTLQFPNRVIVLGSKVVCDDFNQLFATVK